MTTIVTRTETQTDGTAAKGSELTWSEVDTNFINLNDDKVEVSGAIVFAAKAGEALTKGDVVYVSGVIGNEPVVSKADADDASKMPAFGLAETDANLNAAVNVVTFGTLYDLDTSGFTAGDTVYVSTTAGGLTATKPAGESSLIQNIGRVIRSHASAGSIKVGGAGRSNDTPNLNNGNVFIGNASNQAETRALVEADISDFGTYLTSVALNGVSDVTITTPADNEVLAYDSTSSEWINQTAAEAGLATSAQGALADSALQDVVDDTTPQLGGDLDVNGFAIKTAATGDLVLQAADVLQAKYNNGGSTALYANSVSGKIAIGSATVGSAAITLDGSTTVTGAFTSTGIDDNATSTAITIDSSQNVGIGTTPSTALHVKGADPVLTIQDNAGTLAQVEWVDSSGNTMMNMRSGGTDFVTDLEAGGNYIYRNAGSEQFRITSAGSVCVGDEDPDHNGPRSALYVCSEDNNTGVSDNTNIPDIFVGASSTAGGGGAGGEIRFGSRVYGTSGFAAFKGFITDGTANYNLGHLDLNMRANNTSASMTRRFRFEYDGDFHADGDVVAYSATVSDASLKDDVETIDSALDKVSSLRGVTYTWNKGSREGKRDLGVIAQEVEAVLPEIVREKEMPLLDGETYKTVDYEKLTAVLIEAVKELKAEVEALKNGASV